MDFNLIGKFWRWPVNLSGNATGYDSTIIRPSFDADISNLSILKGTNISNFNINFSGEATANLTIVSIIAVIGITILIYYFLIKLIPELSLSRSDELCGKYDSKQEKLKIYSQLCGQKTLIDEYIILFKGVLKYSSKEALIEKSITTNKDLMELIGMALILIPANQRADLDPIDAFGKRIEKVMKAISASIYTFENEKSGISFNELDKSKEELKDSIQKFIDKLLEEIEPKSKEKEIIKSGGNP